MVGVLGTARDECLEQAVDALGRAHLKHYEVSGPELARRRLNDLFDLVVECLAKKALGPIWQYAQRVAEERFDAGFDNAEVQSAFNVLEEAIWHVVLARLPADDLLEAAGLVGTIIGAGKDTLARTWVSAPRANTSPRSI